jgi:hypothetical protein
MPTIAEPLARPAVSPPRRITAAGLRAGLTERCVVPTPLACIGSSRSMLGPGVPDHFPLVSLALKHHEAIAEDAMTI